MMGDNDLIRRGDAFAVVKGLSLLEGDIRALPAVTVGEPCTWPSCGHTARGQCLGLGVRTVPSVNPAAIRAAALREAADRFSRLAALRKMWTTAEIESTILALIDKESGNG